VCAGTQASLYGPNGPLHLADVAVGRYNVEGDEAQQFSDAAEFVVTVHVTDGEPTGLIHTDDPSQTLYDRLFVPVGDRVRGAVTNRMEAGICSAVNVGARGAAGECVILPLRTVMSGPQMRSACCASVGVTGQLRIE
jgi:hypothetical protein